MRKAISEIIVMIMLLMIVVTLASLAFLFMTQFTEQAKSETGQTGAQSIKKISSCLQIVSFDENTNKLTVKNCGRYPVENVTVFIDSKPSFSEVLDIKPNEAKSILITASAAVHEIKIESAYASALILANVTNSCSDGTPDGQCSAIKPKYCNSGVFINKCSACSCPSGYICQADESCIKTWFDPAWNYRKLVSITGSSSALTNYQVLVTADTASLVSAGKMRSDCGDIRFTDSDKKTLIRHWVESGCNSALTKIWVKVPSIPTTGTTIYMYYGNSGATSVSNAVNTFGASTATSAIPGCTLGQACIVSSSQRISSSGIYGHPYVRIESGVTLSVTTKNIYFNIPRLDVYGTLVSHGGGGIGGNGWSPCEPSCPYGRNGGIYYGITDVSFGHGGSGYNAGGLYGGGGGTQYSGVDAHGGNSGGGGGLHNYQGMYAPNYGYGAFLSVNYTAMYVASTGSIMAIGLNGTRTGDGSDTGGGGGGSLIQLVGRNFISNGSIAGIGGDSYIGTNPSYGAGGGGSLIYLNYSNVFGIVSISSSAGDGQYNTGGGNATIITPDGTQTGSASGVTGGSTSKTISVSYSEPFATVSAEEAK